MNLSQVGPTPPLRRRCGGLQVKAGEHSSGLAARIGPLSYCQEPTFPSVLVLESV